MTFFETAGRLSRWEYLQAVQRNWSDTPPAPKMPNDAFPQFWQSLKGARSQVKVFAIRGIHS
ncbi:hypothetical protein TomMM35A_12460 [Sphingobium sp. TomMM35A]